MPDQIQPIPPIQPQVVQTMPQGAIPTTQSPIENTSGQGKDSVIPEGVKGWSWGAFFWTVIWSISNKVWLGLLTLIPYIGLIMLPVLGFKGREWAWRSRHWDSLEQFDKSQHRWSFWGVILFGTAFAGIILLIIIVAINPVARMHSK